MSSTTSAYPLCWPVNRPRTSFRRASKFKVRSFAVVRDELLNELKLMRAGSVVLSSNIASRQDGLPLANQRQPSDPGVAVYFSYKGRAVCFACDRWVKVEDNMQAVRHTIAALRGIARWGTGDMVDAAFTGFAALPGPGATAAGWRSVLGVGPDATLEAVEARYRRMALDHHPDHGGSDGQMARLNEAVAAARRELARPA